MFDEGCWGTCSGLCLVFKAFWSYYCNNADAFLPSLRCWMHWRAACAGPQLLWVNQRSNSAAVAGTVDPNRNLFVEETMRGSLFTVQEHFSLHLLPAWSRVWSQAACCYLVAVFIWCVADTKWGVLRSRFNQHIWKTLMVRMQGKDKEKHWLTGM